MAKIRIPDNQYFANKNVVVETDSSLLISSSKFLNSPAMRDWVSTYLLRRNGADRTVPSDNIDLNKALATVLDADEIEALFEEERRFNPRLDRWLDEKFLSSWRLEDFEQYAPGTLGGLYYRYVSDNDVRMEIHGTYEPAGHYDYFRRRSTQIHDFEHLITGGSFDEIGELVPYFTRLYNIARHLSPELAGQLNVKGVFGALRMVTRSCLHYPHTWIATMNAMQRGMRVGELSEPIFYIRYEDVLHLPLEDARKALGIVGAEDVDTGEASLIFTERKDPPPRRTGPRA